MSTITDVEWNVLFRTPGVVFHFVASADGTIHDTELAAFQEDWRHRYAHGQFSENHVLNEFLRSINDLACKEPPKKITQQDVDGTLNEFKRVLGRFGYFERRRIRKAIAALAQLTAEASGGYFGNKVSAAEQAAVDHVLRLI